MADLTIITNHVPREILDGWQLSPAERETFEYLDWDAIEEGADSASFFRYKGELYDLGDIPAVDRRPGFAGQFQDWDGIATDSFFSGILVRYCEDHESVVVGRFYC